MTKSSQSEVKDIVVGRVGAPHGVKGECKIIPLTDFADRFDDLTEVHVGGELMDIDGKRYHGANVIMKFAACNNREDAAKLTGKLLTVLREKAAPLAEGEYYVFDIVGLSVFDGDSYIGKVTNVIRTGSNDVYEAQTDDGKSLLIPALKKVVTNIDLATGRMTIDMKNLETVGAEE